jgi:hypothetical protein
MRNQLFAFVLAAFAAAPAFAAPQVGQPAPDFTLTDSFGKPQHLADYRGKYVVLEWTNHECPFVRKHYGSGNMQSLQKAAAWQGAAWLTIISSAPGKEGYVSAEQANELTKSRGAAPTAVLFDPAGEVGHKYEAKTTPHMFVIDPKGTLIYMGGIDSIASTDTDDLKNAKPYVKTALAEARAGKPVTDAVTRPYGCSIKYQ